MKGADMTQEEIDDMERYMDRFASLRDSERAWLDDEHELEMMIETAEAARDDIALNILRARLRTMRLVHEHCIRHDIHHLRGTHP